MKLSRQEKAAVEKQTEARIRKLEEEVKYRKEKESEGRKSIETAVM